MHSVRVAAGIEALVARVRLADGTHGFGFTLNLDAGVARDMAAWDALCLSKQIPLRVLLGGSYRKNVKVLKDENPCIAPDWTALRRDILDNCYELLRIDPFTWGSVEMVQTIAAAAAAFDLGIALLAPNDHPWEIQYCAALAATICGEDTRIVVRKVLPFSSIPVSDLPGLGIDWSAEPAFGQVKWQN